MLGLFQVFVQLQLLLSESSNLNDNPRVLFLLLQGLSLGPFIDFLLLLDPLRADLLLLRQF